MGVTGPQLISKETFKEWTKTCGVRKVQREYEKMADEARKNGHSTMEEMKTRGYKDYQSFSKACPEFRLMCWPTEFAELGSGVVLYFHFVAQLGFLFLLLFALQVPAMYQYSQVDWKVGWQWLESPWESYRMTSSCSCLGTNNGIVGPTGAGADYGTSCAAWDMALCSSQADCPFDNPAKWVCQKWCFVSSHCPTAPNEDSPSMTDTRYKGLVRSYSACEEDSEESDDCEEDFRSGDSPFNEEGTEEGHENFVSTMWLTPGNYGPDQAQGALEPTMYTVCVVMICAVSFIAFQAMAVTERYVDSDTTSPNDFAVLVRGLPTTATDGKAIADWFKKHALKPKTEGEENTTEIVKVVIGWDAEEFGDMIRELKELRKEKQRLPDASPRHEEIQERIASINRNLASSATEKAAKLRSSGVVVVVFRYQSDMRACLERWGSFWSRWFYCDATDTCCLPEGNNFWKAGELPLFPIGHPPVPLHKIRVERAPNPGNINWMELGVPRGKRIKMLLKTNAAMFLCFLCSFFACYGLKFLQDYLADGGNGVASDALAVLPALGVGVMNALLSMAAKKLGEREYHDTVTMQEFSQALKMSVGMILNTGGVMFFISAQPKEWYQHGGLVTDAFAMLLLNALLPPFIPFVDLGYRIKGTTRRQLTEEKLQQMNEIGSKKPSSAEDQDALRKVKLDIQKFQKAYAPSPMNETRRFAIALKTAICCLFYTPLLPWISLVGAGGMFLQYWVDKYLLLRWYARPPKPASCHMAMFSLKFIKYVAPLGVTLTAWIFLTPSWQNKNEVYFNFFLCLAISVIFSFIVPLSVWTRTFFGLFGKARVERAEDSADYYKAQYMWAPEMKYHKDHFMLKPLPESLNPEMLEPGKEVAETTEAVKASYGVAMQQASADAGTKAATVGLKGGKVLDAGLAKPGGGGAGPSPSIYGVTSVAPVGAPLVAEEPAPPEPEKPEAPKAEAPAERKASEAVWEFEAGHGGWRVFAADCHSFVEREYQKWREGRGKEQIKVRTGDKELSLNFSKMTQKIVGGTHTRKIRRTQKE